MYKSTSSEFEIQALAYGILRKNLYPEYLTRGEYKFKHEDGTGSRIDIAIFKVTPGQEPKLALVVEVKKTANGKSSRQGERYSKKLGVPYIYIRGEQDAYNALSLVKPLL